MIGPPAAASAAKSLQLSPTLCHPIDGSPPGSPIPGILQARILEWVAISFSNARKWKVKVKSLSHVQLLVTSWTAAYKAPPSMGFSRQEYSSGMPLPSPLVPLSIIQTSKILSFKMKKVQRKQETQRIWILILLGYAGSQGSQILSHQLRQLYPSLKGSTPLADHHACFCYSLLTSKVFPQRNYHSRSWHC